MSTKNIPPPPPPPPPPAPAPPVTKSVPTFDSVDFSINENTVSFSAPSPPPPAPKR